MRELTFQGLSTEPSLILHTFCLEFRGHLQHQHTVSQQALLLQTALVMETQLCKPLGSSSCHLPRPWPSEMWEFSLTTSVELPGWCSSLSHGRLSQCTSSFHWGGEGMCSRLRAGILFLLLGNRLLAQVNGFCCLFCSLRWGGLFGFISSSAILVSWILLWKYTISLLILEEFPF